LPPVNLAPADNERSVANSVNHAFLIARGIDPCGNRLQKALFNFNSRIRVPRDIPLFDGQAKQ
jgi:hypothetical protein